MSCSTTKSWYEVKVRSRVYVDEKSSGLMSTNFFHLQATSHEDAFAQGEARSKDLPPEVYVFPKHIGKLPVLTSRDLALETSERLSTLRKRKAKEVKLQTFRATCTSKGHQDCKAEIFVLSDSLKTAAVLAKRIFSDLPCYGDFVIDRFV